MRSQEPRPSPPSRKNHESQAANSPAAFPWLLLGFVLFLAFIPGSPWTLQNGIIMAGAGALVLLFPPVARIPMLVWAGAGLFLILGLASFLPAGWFPQPAWRAGLADLGVAVGDRVVIQWRQAAEHFFLIAAVLVTAILVTGHRLSSNQAKNVALAFSIGASLWTLAAILLQDRLASINYGYFGFFPNRNHAGTFLAVATVCSFGVALQSLRDRSWTRLGITLASLGILLWGAAGVSVSRAGIILIIVGTVAWLLLLGPGYWTSAQKKAIALIILLVAGSFLIAGTTVGTRLADTWEKIADTGETSAPSDPPATIDFRIPVAKDTASLIADFPLTGIGAGQFRYIFPQYRVQSTGRSGNQILHPESDWLWLAAEFGIPATLALLAAAIAAWTFGLRAVLRGRNRALRGACLVASALIPIHGLFDVPGHRPALLLLAALLLMMAFPHGTTAVPGRKWLLRLPSLVLLAAAFRLLATGSMGIPAPQSVRAREFLDEGTLAYRNIISGRSVKTLSDVRLQRVALMKKTEGMISDNPLDDQLYLLGACASLPFKDMIQTTENRFSVNLALLPHSVDAPLVQAELWKSYDKRKTADLWKIALDRASMADSVNPKWNLTNRAMKRIRKTTGSRPDFEELLQSAIQRKAD